MVKYATKEKQYHCDHCDKWITEREMLSTGIFLEAKSLQERNDWDETFSTYCPGCRVTKWTRIVTMLPSYLTEGQPENWPYELINDNELL